MLTLRYFSILGKAKRRDQFVTRLRISLVNLQNLTKNSYQQLAHQNRCKARALEASEQQAKGIEETSYKNTITTQSKMEFDPARSKEATASSIQRTTTATEKAWSASQTIKPMSSVMKSIYLR